MSDKFERTVDEELLRHLRGVFGGLRAVSQASCFPSNRQESLVVTLDTGYYPEAIEQVRLEVRAYANGEFHVSYHETHLGARRHCRWDRHEQDHNSRDHFHPLPTASTTAAADRAFPRDVTMVLRQHVLPWIERRRAELWEADD